ncbi:hypothetical protein GM658_18350 [Pseudoduganella eburnea]|uniref:Uncharacterized protein n=1 Tax=Massilia eburnea TaxID=1776165 RepID=A0A6L6QKG8_9BURK|nr:hypothetical protein [Massilia eburnea]MTW12574.1 hypothetical protein [Massilia eburnea]
MNARFDNASYEELCAQIDALCEQKDSPEFKSALSQLEKFAEAGSADAAEFLAELLAYDGCCHDAARAYKWYFVSLSSQGYSTEFNDRNGSPAHYRGPVGDFRNESMVSDLVTRLGFEKVLCLDQEAREWLLLYSLAAGTSGSPKIVR